MKFKYSVIGDNTAENREWLKKIGYKRDDSNDGDTLCVGFDGLYQVKKYKLGRTMFNVFLDMMKPINCIGNDELFMAVSAIRDDSDWLQWFITTKDNWVLSRYRKKKQFSKYAGVWKQTSRKATLEELQEHFKK